MHIVSVANCYGPKSGGLRTTMHHLGAGYLAAGHRSTLVVPGERDRRIQTPYGERIEVRAPVLPGSGGYRVIPRVAIAASLLEQLRPDRLEVADRWTLAPLGGWARRAQVPSVLWAHERLDGLLRAFLPGPVPARRIADAWNRRTAVHFGNVVATTAFAAAEFERIGRQVRRVPLGVDLDLFHPGRRRRDDDGVLLLLASRLSAEKRPMVALDALRELHEQGLPVRLAVAGDGPLYGRFAAAARGLPVRMLGFVAERERLADLLASADVLLAPGPIETFGLAALEALASGTPVVAAAGSALPEVVGGAGECAPSDGRSFADAVRRLLARQQPPLRAAARARAEQFGWDATVAAMLAVHGASEVQIA